MVLNIILEEILVLIRERMVRLNLDVAHTFADRHALFTEQLALGQSVKLPHEAAGIEGKGVIALLELVQFLHHRYRDDDIVILELSDSLVVVENYIGIKYENFGFPGRLLVSRNIGIFACHNSVSPLFRAILWLVVLTVQDCVSGQYFSLPPQSSGCG